MPSAFVQAITRHNLCTYYLLPLIHLNKVSFGEGNFIDSYVNSQGTILTVEVIDCSLCSRFRMYTHPQYLQKVYGHGNYDKVIYQLPSIWEWDFNIFKLGQYSKFSIAAKEQIVNYSGLPVDAWNDDGKPLTDARILALVKSPVLKRMWELDLACLPLPDDLELLDIPGDRNYKEYSP